MPRRAPKIAAFATLSLLACSSEAPEWNGPGAVGWTGRRAVDVDTALEYNGYASGWTDCWQSFTAGKTGPLTAVRVWAFLPSNVTVTLYEGEGTSGTILATTTSLIALVDDRWEVALPCVNVTAGQQYTLRLSAASNLNWVVGTYTYAGGTSNVYGVGADFGVTTYVGEPGFVEEREPPGPNWQPRRR